VKIKNNMGDRLLVPTAVSGSATGECGLLPQHFHHRINVAVVTAYTTVSSAYWLCADVKKNNTIFVLEVPRALHHCCNYRISTVNVSCSAKWTKWT